MSARGYKHFCTRQKASYKKPCFKRENVVYAKGAKADQGATCLARCALDSNCFGVQLYASGTCYQISKKNTGPKHLGKKPPPRHVCGFTAAKGCGERLTKAQYARKMDRKFTDAVVIKSGCSAAEAVAVEPPSAAPPVASEPPSFAPPVASSPPSSSPPAVEPPSPLL